MAKVLIADDNPQNAELLDAHLDGTGVETKVATNGEETLALAKSWLPDLVLLDVMMPKLSGFEVCKRLRTDLATKDISILMVTALDQPADIDRAVDAGTDDFVTKPLSKAELVLRVKAMLAARSETIATDRTLAYIRGVQDGL